MFYWIQQAASLLGMATKDFFQDSGPQWAAAIAYYSLLSAFPLLLGAVSIFAYFVDPEWAVDQAGNLLGDLIPQGSGQVEEIVQEAIDARRSVGILSIMALLWSGSRVFGVITRSLNHIFEGNKGYGFFKRTLIELLMLLTIGVLFVLALASRFILQAMGSRIQSILGDGELVYQGIQTVVPIILLFCTFYLIFRYVPRKQVNWKSALVGTFVATSLFLVARPIFIYYIQSFANYSLIYGPIAIVVVLVLWAWLVSIFLLFGGEIVSHFQRMVIEGKPARIVEEEHQQQSPSRTNQAERTDQQDHQKETMK